ncbi:MAG: prephenate dehydratase [Burkholderiaceae bacterium]
MAIDENTDPDLARLRAEIDALDAQILTLLNRRAGIALEVGAAKEHTGAPVFRPEREAQVLRGLCEKNTGPLPSGAVQNIYREIISACRALEKTLVVAYLGPAGTFSEQAVLRQFGQAVEPQPCESIDDIFRAVETGQADFGVVPVENSTEGAINRTLDLFLQTPLKITGEVALRIEHHLLTLSGTVEGVTKIYAHAQALAQCNQWLNRHHPRIDRVACASNGEAARLASGDPGVAAVAGALAAQRYGLKKAAEHIQDDPQNTTRFAVIGQGDAQPSGRDHTSLILSVPNRAGAVHDMLSPLKEHGVSMTRFESRPARTGIWLYYFYIDIEGHRADARTAAALDALRDSAGFFKLLGSYPVN